VLGKPIEREYSLFDLLRRPDVTYASLMTLPGTPEPIAHAAAIEQLDILAKYQGYIDRQQDEVERHRATEDTRLPEDIDYAAVGGLSREAQQKLTQHRPETLGQASRIQGMTPAAISLLRVHLKKRQAIASAA
jgi:tRNA uridine 5-carboxymethylaminomethyl modification enzyme